MYEYDIYVNPEDEALKYNKDIKGMFIPGL